MDTARAYNCPYAKVSFSQFIESQKCKFWDRAGYVYLYRPPVFGDSEFILSQTQHGE